MPNVFNNLSKKDLQDAIGSTSLTQLSELLPLLEEGSFNGDKLYTKSSLVKIFESFAGKNYLAAPKTRKYVFDHLPPDMVDETISQLGLTPTDMGSFGEKIDYISKSWKSSRRAKIIATTLGIATELLPEEEIPFRTEEFFVTADRPYKPLKDYQVSVHARAMEQVYYPKSRFIVQMPTGSGKTRTAMEIIAGELNSQDKTDNIVLWLAHSNELCEQAFECFVDIWPHVATVPIRGMRYWGPSKSLSSEFEGKAFIVGGFQKLYELVKSNSPIIEELQKRVSLIVVDEAHRVTAPTYAAVTKAFMGEDTRVVGLTATPGKSAIDSEQNQELAEFFFSTLVDIQPETKDMDVIDYLRKKKVLASAMYVPLVTGRDYELTPKELKQLEESFDFPPSFLARLGLDQIRNLEILKKIQGEIEIGNTILFFGATVEQSKLVSGVLRMLGIAADHIDGKTPRAQRHAMIDSFRNGRLSVLCNFGVLSTGFDAPKTDVVFIARPTQSIVLYSQMIGRGLRGPAIGGTDTCKIIDVLDNIKGYSDQNSVYSYFEEYFNQ